MQISYYRIKGPNYILGLGPCSRAWVVRGGTNGKEWSGLRIQWAKYKWEDYSKRNISSNMMSTTQIYLPMIKVTFHEALMIEMCIMNIREGREFKISKEKLLPPHWMYCSYFSGRIYVEKISKQCCLGYHNSQRVKEGVWWDRYSNKCLDDQQV